MNATDSRITRRQVLAAGTVFAGYTLAVETVLAQAIKTDTSGLAAGDFTIPVGGFNVPVYEARPASGQNHPHRAGHLGGLRPARVHQGQHPAVRQAGLSRLRAGAVRA